MPFENLAAQQTPALDELTLALAAEFREVDSAAALARLDALAADVPSAGAVAELVEVLAVRHGFTGDRETYDDPSNSMLDLVLERRQGLPILLSVLYVEVARRAGIALAGFGLPGHFVCGTPDGATLVDPFHDGVFLEADDDVRLEPWGPHGMALLIPNNLVASFRRRGDGGRARRAAELRVALRRHDASAERELRGLRAGLN